MMKKLERRNLAEIDFVRAAQRLGVEEAALRAVVEVECSSRGGMLADGRARILFEGHIFWRQLNLRGIDPAPLAEAHRDILYPRWTKKHYRGGAGEWERFERAYAISPEAAIASASWGLFQIMGFHFRTCGARSEQEFMEFMNRDEATQLELSLTFMQKTGVAKYLKTKDWINFARCYNGSGYAANRYDERLAAAYERFSKQMAQGEEPTKS